MIYVQEPAFENGKPWSRFTADSEEELLEYAELIALRPEWMLEPGTPQFHFEIIGTKLKMALTDPKVQYLTVAEFEELLQKRVSSGG